MTRSPPKSSKPSVRRRRKHHSYDADEIASLLARVRARSPSAHDFRARFIGKVSPVHLFWGGPISAPPGSPVDRRRSAAAAYPTARTGCKSSPTATRCRARVLAGRCRPRAMFYASRIPRARRLRTGRLVEPAQRYDATSASSSSPTRRATAPTRTQRCSRSFRAPTTPLPTSPDGTARRSSGTNTAADARLIRIDARPRDHRWRCGEAAAAWHATRQGAAVLLVNAHDHGRATDAGAGIVSPETDLTHDTFPTTTSSPRQPSATTPSSSQRSRAKATSTPGTAAAASSLLHSTTNRRDGSLPISRCCTTRDGSSASQRAGAALYEITPTEARTRFPPLADVTPAFVSHEGAAWTVACSTRPACGALDHGLTIEHRRVDQLEDLQRADAVLVAGGAWWPALSARAQTSAPRAARSCISKSTMQGLSSGPSSRHSRTTICSHSPVGVVVGTERERTTPASRQCSRPPVSNRS